MIRLSTILWLILVSAAGFGMFEVKYAVMDLEDTLAKTNRSIVADQDAIHVLKAEWSYLSQPSRLDELSRRFLDLAPMRTAQLGQLDSLPMRPAALPPLAAASATLPPQIASTAKAGARTPTPMPKPVQATPAQTPATQTPASVPTPSVQAPTAPTRVAAAKLRTEP
jgi:hypothetical protein